MKQWGSILGGLGSVASIVSVVDTYFLKSRLAEVLSLPPQVPTGLAGLLLLAFSAMLLFSTKGTAQRERLIGKLEAEKEDLSSRLQQAQQTVQHTQSELERARSQVAEGADLPDRVYAILIRRDASIEEISRALQHDPSRNHEIVGAIARLVKDRKVTRGALSSDYRAVVQ